MKKFFVLLITCLIMFSFSGCSISFFADRDIGESKAYTKAEISSAMDEVCSYFSREIDGCILLELSYNENSLAAAEEWAINYSAKKAIVIYSDFYVFDENDGSLEQGEVYSNWSWILTKSHGKNWKVETYGFG